MDIMLRHFLLALCLYMSKDLISPEIIIGFMLVLWYSLIGASGLAKPFVYILLKCDGNFLFFFLLCMLTLCLYYLVSQTK